MAYVTLLQILRELPMAIPLPDAAATPSESAADVSSRVDQVGAVASIACAVHCASWRSARTDAIAGIDLVGLGVVGAGLCRVRHTVGARQFAGRLSSPSCLPRPGCVGPGLAPGVVVDLRPLASRGRRACRRDDCGRNPDRVGAPAQPASGAWACPRCRLRALGGWLTAFCAFAAT